MRYDPLLFDLDGTLADTAEGVLNGVIYTLDAYGIAVEDKQTLLPFMGPPLSYSFRTFYGFSEEEAQRAVTIYRQRYDTKGQFECRVFPGIPELLGRLREREHRIYVATSKLEKYAVSMLGHLGIAGYFDEIVGSDPAETLGTKAAVIEEVLRRANVTDRSRVLMIGDRKYDIIGANACGVDSLGVYLGYAEPNELEDAGATYIVRGVDGMERFLLNM